MAKPGDADPFAGRKAVHTITEGMNMPDDFVAWYDRQCRVGQITVDDMQVGAADAAGRDFHQNLARTGIRRIACYRF
jgi:hypothetical protein